VTDDDWSVTAIAEKLAGTGGDASAPHYPGDQVTEVSPGVFLHQLPTQDEPEAPRKPRRWAR
jgi:hypothetical protein